MQIHHFIGKRSRKLLSSLFILLAVTSMPITGIAAEAVKMTTGQGEEMTLTLKTLPDSRPITGGSLRS